MDNSFEEVEEKELYIQDGVFHGYCKNHYSHDCGGTLSIVQSKEYDDQKKKWIPALTIEWKPAPEAKVESDTQDSEWQVVSTEVRKTRTLSTSSDSSRAGGSERISIPLSEVGSFRLNHHGKCVSVKLREEKNPNNFFTFSNSNGSLFVMALIQVVPAVSTRKDSNLYTIMRDNEQEYHRLTKSFSELNIEHTSNGHSLWGLINHVRDDPYEAAMGALSKITDAFLYRGAEQRPEEASDLLTQSLTREHADELRIAEAAAAASNDEYEVIHRPVRIDLDRCVPQPRGQPLTLERWSQGMDLEGRIADPQSIKKLIFRGGVADDVRAEVWTFILGVYPWNSTHSERTAIRAKNVEEYYIMRRQWESMTPAQEDRFTDFKDRKSLIAKDVHRTDRVLPYFAGDDNPNVEALMRILMTYVMYNFDLGYVQGMSDLLAPLLELFNNEVDAFWCFVGFMDRVGSNFDMDQEGMKQQLLNVRTLIAFLDPNLLNYLDRNDSGNMFFCFRWLIVLFKREFSRDDIMRIWEVLWSDLPCKNFQLLLCVAVLETEKGFFYKNNFSFNEILKHVNELSTHINLENMLSRAEGIYQLLIEKSDELPDCVRVILGLPPQNVHVWVPPPVPQLGGQSEERASKSPNGSRSHSSPQPANQSGASASAGAGAGEPGTSQRATSPGSDSERDSSIETIPNGIDAEDSFEKAISSQYF